MMSELPDYLKVTAAELGRGTPVKVRILGDMASVGQDMAETLLQEMIDALSRISHHI